MSAPEYHPEAPLQEKLQALMLLLLRALHAPRPTPTLVSVLCAALEDPNWTIRAEAARHLETVGTTEAVGPLLKALRAAGGPPWPERFAVTAGSMLTLAAAALVGKALLAGRGGFLPGLVAFLMILQWLLHQHRLSLQPRCRLCQALAFALAAIAEREPSPATREAVPHLEALARDFLHHAIMSRRAFRDAAVRIKAATPGQAGR